MKLIIYGALGICLGVYLAEQGVITTDQIQDSIQSGWSWIQSKMATANNLQVIDTV